MGQLNLFKVSTVVKDVHLQLEAMSHWQRKKKSCIWTHAITHNLIYSEHFWLHHVGTSSSVPKNNSCMFAKCYWRLRTSSQFCILLLAVTASYLNWYMSSGYPTMTCSWTRYCSVLSISRWLVHIWWLLKTRTRLTSCTSLHVWFCTGELPAVRERSTRAENV